MKLSGSRSILHVASARATFGKSLHPSQCLWLPIGLLFPPRTPTGPKMGSGYRWAGARHAGVHHITPRHRTGAGVALNAAP